MFVFGLGAIIGPLATGWAMDFTGPAAFWTMQGGTFLVIALYALYRMTQRAQVPVEETESYISVVPGASPVAVEAASAWAAENAESDAAAESPDDATTKP